MLKKILSMLMVAFLAMMFVVSGGKVFSIFVGLVAILSLKEMIDLKRSHGKYPSAIVLFSTIMLLVLVFYEYYGHILSYGISQRLLILLGLGLFLPLVIEDDDHYSSHDAFYLFGVTAFLGICYNNFITLREQNINIIWYLFIIALINCFIKCLFKSDNKILPFVLSLLLTVCSSSIFYCMVISMENIVLVILQSLILTLMNKAGNVFFEKVKDENNVKKFSDVIPGFGGILDVLGGFMFILISYVIIMKLV